MSPAAKGYGGFGYSVAISGTEVVVGAPYQNASRHIEGGHAYAFNGSSGLLSSSLTSPSSQTDGTFGYSVAIDGTTIVVGAPGENVSAQSGAGHVYTFNATTGALISTLLSPNAQSGGQFGFTVAASLTLIVVGAPYETASNDSGAGHAYVFDVKTGRLVATLTSPNVQVGGGFGASVAISGTKVVVGSPYESAAGNGGAGHAYIFDARTATLVTTLTSPNAQVGGYFGWSVGVSGETAVVGAPFETASGLGSAGNAYTFDAGSGSLISTLTSPNAQAVGEFGDSVAISPNRVVVGAPGENVGSWSYAGHAYNFNPKTGTLISTLTSRSAQNNGHFGDAVAVSATTVVVGACNEKTPKKSDGGRAYVF